jgi:hypothetical protein
MLPSEIGRFRLTKAGEIPAFLDELPLPDEAKNARRLPVAPEVQKHLNKK